MWVPGAMTATSAASVMMKPADAARPPAGPTKTTTGARDVDHPRHDIARRIEQPSRRSQHDDDDVRARDVRLVNDAGQVFRRDRMDDAIELRDDGERAMRGRLRRRHCDGAQEDLSREQSSPHVEIVCPTRSRATRCAGVRVVRRLVRESESGDDSYQLGRIQLNHVADAEERWAGHDANRDGLAQNLKLFGLHRRAAYVSPSFLAAIWRARQCLIDRMSRD